MACAIPSLLLCCLLLVAPQLSSSFSTSYTHDENHVVFRSPGGASPAASCLDIPSAYDDDGGITTTLPVFHRLSPCSPHAGAQSPGNSSAAGVLRRDTHGLRSLTGSGSGIAVAPSTTGSAAYVHFPGSSEYHVVVGYGTPPQRLALGFDIISTGLSLLVCERTADSRAFDPSRSSSLEEIPCDTPHCPIESCTGSTCMSSVSSNHTVYVNMTVVVDMLTLSGSTTMDMFRFACLETGSKTVDDDTLSGILDVSQHIHSLASRAPPSPYTAAFSYCLPSATTSHGFLSIAPLRPEHSGSSVSYTALRHKPGQPNMYFVQLTGITVGGKNIPVPPAGFTGDSVVALRTTFTYLKPDIYAVFREELEGRMKRYSHLRVPPVGGFENCYDFAGVRVIIMPSVTLEFEGGAVMDLEMEQMMYLQEPHNAFSVACLAFAPSPYRESHQGSEAPVAIIGTLARANTEVVYDTRRGMLGFAPDAC